MGLCFKTRGQHPTPTAAAPTLPCILHVESFSFSSTATYAGCASALTANPIGHATQLAVSCSVCLQEFSSHSPRGGFRGRVRRDSLPLSGLKSLIGIGEQKKEKGKGLSFASVRKLGRLVNTKHTAAMEIAEITSAGSFAGAGGGASAVILHYKCSPHLEARSESCPHAVLLSSEYVLVVEWSKKLTPHSATLFLHWSPASKPSQDHCLGLWGLPSLCSTLHCNTSSNQLGVS